MHMFASLWLFCGVGNSIFGGFRAGRGNNRLNVWSLRVNNVVSDNGSARWMGTDGYKPFGSDVNEGGYCGASRTGDHQGNSAEFQ